MNNPLGYVCNIQKFCAHDGPGIRTTVFLQGCPLSCRWCHNPETQFPRPVLMLFNSLCIGCGACVNACPQGCHSFSRGTHRIDWTRCVSCGKCTQVCVGALKMSSELMSCKQVMDIVRQDSIFYKNSNGGLTLSGGEPLFQYEFSYALLRLAKAENIHTCVETCGFADRMKLSRIAAMTDLFLFDWKLSDDALHRRYTGASNKPILGNLEMLNAMNANIVLRCPLVPGLHDSSHLEQVASLANRLASIKEIHIMAYHNLGNVKYPAVGQSDAMGNFEVPSDKRVGGWICEIQQKCSVRVKVG